MYSANRSTVGYPWHTPLGEGEPSAEPKLCELPLEIAPFPVERLMLRINLWPGD